MLGVDEVRQLLGERPWQSAVLLLRVRESSNVYMADYHAAVQIFLRKDEKV